jgi:fructokinase/N-acetylglucosamine kinase
MERKNSASRSIARLYATVPILWRRYVFSGRVDTRLVPPKYGDTSGVRGAAVERAEI